MHPDKIKKGLLWIRDEFNARLGLYRGTVGMIAGLPYEPVESWYNSLDWLNKNWESFFYWGLHISDDPDTKTHSDFSVDAKKFGYLPTKNKELIIQFNMWPKLENFYFSNKNSLVGANALIILELVRKYKSLNGLS